VLAGLLLGVGLYAVGDARASRQGGEQRLVQGADELGESLRVGLVTPGRLIANRSLVPVLTCGDE
jgi:hypothetical protein